jgi:hypothetical protein
MMKERPASEHRSWIGSLRYRAMERTSLRAGVKHAELPRLSRRTSLPTVWILFGHCRERALRSSTPEPITAAATPRKRLILKATSAFWSWFPSDLRYAQLSPTANEATKTGKNNPQPRSTGLSQRPPTPRLRPVNAKSRNLNPITSVPSAIEHINSSAAMAHQGRALTSVECASSKASIA